MNSYESNNNSMDLEGMEKTDCNSFNDNWKYVSDTMKILRTRLGDRFPKSYQAYVGENGAFESGKVKYTWKLADTTIKDSPVIISQRTAMKSISRKGKEYYMLRTYEEHVTSDQN